VGVLEVGSEVRNSMMPASGRKKKPSLPKKNDFFHAGRYRIQGPGLEGVAEKLQTGSSLGTHPNQTVASRVRKAAFNGKSLH
jgi:hypothetical protein